MVLAQRAEFAEMQAARLAHEAELGAELAAARAGLIEQRFEIGALKTRLSKLLRLSFSASSEKLRTQVEQLELMLGDVDELDALSGKGLALAVQRQVLSKLRVQDRGQQLGAGTSARDQVERCRRLADGFARPAAEPFAHGLDHLPAPGHHFQRLGFIRRFWGK